MASDLLEGNVQLLHSVACQSLSGQSNVTYQIGGDEDAKMYIRIDGETSGGFFSPKWKLILWRV